MKARPPDVYTGITTEKTTGHTSKYQHASDPRTPNKHIGTNRYHQ